MLLFLRHGEQKKIEKQLIISSVFLANFIAELTELQKMLKMQNISISSNNSEPIYIVNRSNYCICRTYNVSLRPCKKISHTSLSPAPPSLFHFSRARCFPILRRDLFSKFCASVLKPEVFFFRSFALPFKFSIKFDVERMD